ncbi:rhomboid family intramembrane serine protease [Microlunatus soli]|uniref:rhomboid family intramembrane serine protease n=1 Tax=Microlunatus soli TaxID=630515 RepID=UPI0012F7D790|nr:rhomboid family intramembrane serine protease [Microlunatus soli]
MTALTAVVSIPALFVPSIVTALQQDPGLIRHGQWWRLITPMLVQGYGIGQFVFNLAGIVLAGSAVERRTGPLRWLTIYLIAGVVSIAVTSAIFPDRVDSGSSAAVAGLIGALVVTTAIRRESPPLPALLYTVFFAAYLSGLALAGPVVGAVAGSAGVAAIGLARRVTSRSALRLGAAAVVITATAAMLAVGDVHGIGLLTGMIIAAALSALVDRRPSAAEDRPRGR